MLLAIYGGAKSIHAVSQASGIHHSTISYAMKRLIAQGYVERLGRRLILTTVGIAAVALIREARAEEAAASPP